MFWAVRYRTHRGSGWVVGIEGTVLTYSSKKKAKAALRWAVENAERGGEWFEVAEYAEEETDA